MKKNTTVLMTILAIVVIIAAGLFFSGSYKDIFSDHVSRQVGNVLTLDLETLQTTIRTVSSPVIEKLQFVETIDTLSAKADVRNLRNPFVRVYVAPPPSEKPKEEPKDTKPKKAVKKPVVRKKRIVRPKITINGIIWDRSAPYAILNNDIYGEGDQIAGYTVQTIQDTMIVLGNSEDIFSIVIERE
ncbi:MAG: hypothetical protein HQ507_03270 [Candidatus Marinimicrobia bacterium]|nr:hypothetical protein [Candidatus Neomarinimicrobiota bacterium]